MSTLTTKGRDSLSDSSFALPNRRYPIHDANHARAALSMVAKYGDEREKTIVRAKVKARYPGIA